MRYRYQYMIFGMLAILLAFFITDPDVGILQSLPVGGSTIAMLLNIAKGGLYCTAVFCTMKAFLDYPEADLKAFFAKAKESPEGAGFAAIAKAIFFLAIAIIFVGQARANSLDARTYIPTTAYTYLPLLKSIQTKYWLDHPMPEYFGGLIEHESCITLSKPACFTAKAKLLTTREEGASFGQITRTWDKNGKIRFDSLAELRQKHPAELGNWNWENVYTRPELSLTGIVLKSRDDYKALYAIKDPLERLKFTDVSYNQGRGKTNADRRECGLRSVCNPQVWFDNVELTCSGNNAAIYGRSQCNISRHHVDDVFNTRANKYKFYLS